MMHMKWSQNNLARRYVNISPLHAIANIDISTTKCSWTGDGVDLAHMSTSTSINSGIFVLVLTRFI